MKRARMITNTDYFSSTEKNLPAEVFIAFSRLQSTVPEVARSVDPYITKALNMTDNHTVMLALHYLASRAENNILPESFGRTLLAGLPDYARKRGVEQARSLVSCRLMCNHQLTTGDLEQLLNTKPEEFSPELCEYVRKTSGIKELLKLVKAETIGRTTLIDQLRQRAEKSANKSFLYETEYHALKQLIEFLNQNSNEGPTNAAVDLLLNSST